MKAGDVSRELNSGNTKGNSGGGDNQRMGGRNLTPPTPPQPPQTPHPETDLTPIFLRPARK